MSRQRANPVETTFRVHLAAPVTGQSIETLLRELNGGFCKGLTCIVTPHIDVLVQHTCGFAANGCRRPSRTILYQRIGSDGLPVLHARDAVIVPFNPNQPVGFSKTTICFIADKAQLTDLQLTLTIVCQALSARPSVIRNRRDGFRVGDTAHDTCDFFGFNIHEAYLKHIARSTAGELFIKCWRCRRQMTVREYLNTADANAWMDVLFERTVMNINVSCNACYIELFRLPIPRA